MSCGVGAAKSPIEQNARYRSYPQRVRYRVRRRAQKLGVRPLRLHCARHTWATLALESGKSVRWVADQLGHADPAITLRVYAHAIPEAETDLSFADFAGPGRPYTAPRDGLEHEDSPKSSKEMVTRARFERATPSFGGWCSIQLSYRATRAGRPPCNRPAARLKTRVAGGVSSVG